MMPRFRLLPAAWVDLEQQLQYIAERNPDAARHLRDVLWHGFEQIAAHPYSGPSHRARSSRAFGLRVKHLPRFPNYRIFYRVTDSRAVEIIRILHTARDLPRELGGDR